MRPRDTAGSPEPGRDCPRCPRLVAFRQAQRHAHPDWHNAPVPSFGALDARLLVVGLAPGLKGANRTSRPFTGDYAGKLLYGSLKRFGFATGEYEERADDGFRLIDARVTNAARCVPPQNKPLPSEFAACRDFLADEIAAMPNLKAILALGKESHDQCLSVLGLKPRNRFPFAHAAMHEIGQGRVMADSYHCSRLNTNTGRLTEAMFDAVVADLRKRLD
ncbi:MAG: uracil-DNA glycosylase [Alphaproteobacteria bacterium]